MSTPGNTESEGEQGTGETLAGALEREHREIDRGIAAFLEGLVADRVEVEPLTRAIEALRRHIYLEEELLFPPLRDAGLMAPVFVMLREHGEIWRTLEQIDAGLGAGPDGAVPRDRAVAGDRALLRDGCLRLLAQLESHNAKEEPVLYPQADAVLASAAAADLSEFLAAGRAPEGWVCSQAGSGRGRCQRAGRADLWRA